MHYLHFLEIYWYNKLSNSAINYEQYVNITLYLMLWQGK
jgi:hypothetical protein